MLTANEWNKAKAYLENGDEGDYVDNGERKVEVANLAGGRYLHYVKERWEDWCGDLHEAWVVAGQTDEVVKSLHFLNTGKFFAR